MDEIKFFTDFLRYSNYNENKKYYFHEYGKSFKCTHLIYAFLNLQKFTISQIELLIKFYKNTINDTIENGDTVLIIACNRLQNENVSFVELLIRNGADVNKKCVNDLNPLAKIIYFYIGGKLSYNISRFNKSPLIFLEDNNFIRLYNLFLEYKADLNLKISRGNYLIHNLIKCFEYDSRFFRVLNLILEDGVLVNLKNYMGNTALHLAIDFYIHSRTTSSKIIFLLLKYGALTDIPNNKNITVLSIVKDNNVFSDEIKNYILLHYSRRGRVNNESRIISRRIPAIRDQKNTCTENEFKINIGNFKYNK